MAIVFDESGLESMKFPCVVQQFINHNAVLYKVLMNSISHTYYCTVWSLSQIFVVGKLHFLVHRPSIKNLAALGQ